MPQAMRSPSSSGAGEPAKFDVGLKFIQLEPEALELLAKVLGPPEEQLETPDPPAPKSSSRGKQ